jgi:phage-related protein
MDVAPVIIITASASCAKVVIGDDVNGWRLAWQETLASAELIKIDCENWLVYHSTDGGTVWSESMSNVEGTFLLLDPAQDTATISVAGVSSGTMDITFRARYL